VKPEKSAKIEILLHLIIAKIFYEIKKESVMGLIQ